MGRRQHNTLGPGECPNTFREAQIILCHCEIQAKTNLLGLAVMSGVLFCLQTRMPTSNRTERVYTFLEGLKVIITYYNIIITVFVAAFILQRYIILYKSNTSTRLIKMGGKKRKVVLLF